MKIEGYCEHQEDETDWEVQVYLSTSVLAYLDSEGRKGNRNERHVKKSKHILTTLKRFGLDRVRGSAQFKREGSFPSGRHKGGDQVVYEVKSDQVRIYGGSLTVSGVTSFYFVEAVTKQTNKADPDVLKRVAKALGKINDELESRKTRS